MKNLKISKLTQGFKEVFAMDLRSLAVFRVLLGIFLLYDLFMRALDLKMFYSNDGILPINEVLRLTSLPSSFSIHIASGATLFQAFLFLLAAVFAICLIVGYKTRWMVVLSWLLLVSLQNRNPIILQGGDVVARLTLFWAIFLPLGARYSVDYLLAKPAQRIKELKHYSLAGFAFILQIALIYFFSALLKTGAEWKVDFTATWFALSLEQFSTGLGKFMLNFPWLLGILTFVVWWWELIVGWLLIFPFFNKITRSVGAFGLIFMHIGFRLMMNLGPFPIISVASFTAIMPTAVWELADTSFKKIPKQYKKLQKFAATLQLKYLNLLKRVKIIPENIKSFNQPATGRKQTSLEFFTINMIVSCVVLFTLIWNVGTVRKDVNLGSPYNQIVMFFRFDQMWNMFAPFPLRTDGWYVITGDLADGSQAQLFGFPRADKYAKPADIASEYTTERWRKYLMNLQNADYTAYRPLLARYYCNEWNLNPVSHRLTDVHIEFMQRTTQLPGVETFAEKVVLLSYRC